MNKLNPTYVAKGYSSTYTNMKSVAYLLDTDIWSTFVGTGAEFATGGTSIEILLNSYSQKFGLNCCGVVINETGYYVSNDGGKTSSEYIDDLVSAGQNFYCLANSESKALQNWLASPSADGTWCIMSVSDWGWVDNPDITQTSRGFRPMVALSTGVTLIEQTDGTYSIEVSN